MIEIGLAVIPDTPQDTGALTRLVNEFSRENRVAVHIHTLDWGEAWDMLAATATHGAGPDVSQVGSTWLGNLVKMNALRSFNFSDLSALSNEKAFIAPA